MANYKGSSKAEALVKAMGFDVHPKKESVARMTKVCETNDHLLNDLSPHPAHQLDNIVIYNYTHPAAEFIEDPGFPTLGALAEKWNVSTSLLLARAERERWGPRRAEYWQKVSQAQWNMAPEHLATLRAKVVMEHYSDYREARLALKSAARRHMKEQIDPMSGEVVETLWTMDDWAKYLKALETSVNGERLSLGIDAKLQQEQDNGRKIEAKGIHFHFSKRETPDDVTVVEVIPEGELEDSLQLPEPEVPEIES